VDENIIAHLDSKKKVVSLEFSNASKNVGCDVSALGGISKVRNPTLCLRCRYFPSDDVVDIFLLEKDYFAKSVYTTDEVTSSYPILVTTNQPGQIIGLQIDDASAFFCETFVKQLTNTSNK
jgi:uncharacterized protein YuzE